MNKKYFFNKIKTQQTNSLVDTSSRLVRVFKEIEGDSKRKSAFKNTLKNSGFVIQLEKLLKNNMVV